MAIIVDGSGSTVTHNAVAIANVNTIKFNIQGEKAEIDLTGLGNVEYETAALSKIKKMKDFVLNVKNDPVLIAALHEDNAAMVITLSDADATVITIWCHLKSDGDGDVAPKVRTDVDLTYLVTNRNATGVETGIAVV